jgi:hypothetical protein
MRELDDLVQGMSKLDKLLGAGNLHKAALDAMVARLVDIDKRLTKLESREDWPAFFEAAVLAPIAANFHPAPKGIQ